MFSPRRPLRYFLFPLVGVAAAACGSDKSGITGVGGSPSPNFVQLQSDPGDYIGGGQTYNYTQASAILTVTANGGHLSVSISGDQQWSGDFQSPSALTQLQPGTYSGLQRYPFNDPATRGLSWYGEGRGCNILTASFTVDSVTYANGNLTTIDLRFEQHCEGGNSAGLRRYPFGRPARGGLSWDGEGRGCNPLLGWFAIDGITYTNGSLTALDLRFEQHCEGGTPALHGAIHWSA